MTLCPVCGSKKVGKIEMGNYFCWDCLMVFNNQNEIFQVMEDGSLIVNGR